MGVLLKNNGYLRKQMALSGNSSMSIDHPFTGAVQGKQETSFNMKKVLIIEDDLHLQNEIEELLGLNGFQVIKANNGALGVDLAQTQSPDLILCDVMIPELDGYGVLKALRNNPITKPISVIMLTACSEHSNIRQGMELGADDYLTKPFTAQELLQAIITRLERQDILIHQTAKEHQQIQKLKQEVQSSQQQLQKSQQFAELQTELLQRLARELRDPLSNINMAIHMLKRTTSEEERDRYLIILQEECAREIQLLNEVDSLQKLLSPENTRLLQRFKLLK